VRENGHNKGHDITCLPAMQLPTSSMPSWVVLGSTLPMHISGVRGIHWQDTCVEKHGTRTCHEQPRMTTAANRNQGQQDPLRGEKLLPRTPFDHVLPPFLSLVPIAFTCVTCSPCDIKGRAGVLLRVVGGLLFYFFLLSLEELSLSPFFFYLRSDLAPTSVPRLLLREPRTHTLETWDRAPSLAHLYSLL
jgi:hypothetical protein